MTSRLLASIHRVRSAVDSSLSEIQSKCKLSEISMRHSASPLFQPMKSRHVAALSELFSLAEHVTWLES
jgi:hypothetical protein